MGLVSSIMSLFGGAGTDRSEPKAPASRALDAGGFGPRNQGRLSITSPGVLHAQRSTIAGRLQREVLNSPTLARVVETLDANLIGTGIVPRSRHPSEAVRTILHARFGEWSDVSDADGRADFYGLQSLMLRDLPVHGEALFLWTADPATGAPQLRHLAPQQLDAGLTRMAEGGNWISQGVEFDALGRRVAYWIRPAWPADAAAGLALAPQRVPAADVLHIFKSLMAGQVRGLPWLTQVLMSAIEHDELHDAMLVRAKTAAALTGFIEESDAAITQFFPYLSDPTVGGSGDEALEQHNEWGEYAAKMHGKATLAGTITAVPPTWKMNFVDMPDQGGAEYLGRATLRLIAAGSGCTYESISGDYSSVNYSSARTAMLDLRRWYEGVQHRLLIPQFCAPVWRRWINWEILAGTIPAAEFVRSRRDFLAVSWLPPSAPWVDPKNEAEAAVIAINAGLRSRTEIAAERGVDVEDLDRENAADLARLKALGLAPAVAPPAPAARAEVVDHMLFRGAFKPSSVNEQARTVELVASTGAGVVRSDMAGPFLEVLAVSAEAVDLGRIEGMPLLDSHRQDTLDRVLGVVRSARIEAGQLIVTVEISQRAQAYWADIRSGIITNVSIGYVPVSWVDGLDALGARVRTITKWALKEVSFVPVGADPTAKVRTSA